MLQAPCCLVTLATMLYQVVWQNSQSFASKPGLLLAVPLATACGNH